MIGVLVQGVDDWCRAVSAVGSRSYASYNKWGVDQESLATRHARRLAKGVARRLA